MKISVDTGDISQLAAAWEQAPHLVEAELVAATWEAELLLEREIKEDTPVGATSSLRQSIHSDAPRTLANTVIGVVGTASMHALPVELGTKPHFPPIEPLITWLEASPQGQALMARARARDPGVLYYEVAQGIARKIAVRGTLGVGMFHRNARQLQPQIRGLYEEAAQRIAEGLASGG
jgi:hypothetical protein